MSRQPNENDTFKWSNLLPARVWTSITIFLISLLLSTEFYMIDESGLLKMGEVLFPWHPYFTITKYVFMFKFLNYSNLFLSVASLKPNLSGDADRFHQCLF